MMSAFQGAYRALLLGGATVLLFGGAAVPWAGDFIFGWVLSRTGALAAISEVVFLVFKVLSRSCSLAAIAEGVFKDLSHAATLAAISGLILRSALARSRSWAALSEVVFGWV
jgi:hypothetical protein